MAMEKSNRCNRRGRIRNGGDGKRRPERLRPGQKPGHRIPG